jgi:S1-C subfamily serine protease
MKPPRPPTDTRIVVALIVVCVLLAGMIAVVYVDLKADLDSLKNENSNLSSEINQLANLPSEVNSEISRLESLVQRSYVNQTVNLTAVQIYNQTMPSVVLIDNQPTGGGSTVEGTGFVYDSQGDIITNNHVVENAATITVTFYDGSSETAKIRGTDVYSDLALIRVNSLPPEAVPLGPRIRNSTSLLVGEPVYAIGNPFGLTSSMTSGIVSQVGRVLSLSSFGVPPPEGNYQIVDVIQFDASVNPGNSGGPLLDGAGNVIGVTFAIETGNTGVNAFIGIAYAVPSILLLRVIPALNSTGHYYHPYVGIEYNSNYTNGLHISAIEPGSPAEEAGLQVGDVIKQVDNVQVKSGDDLLIYLERYKSPGDTITLMIDRNSIMIEKALTLGIRPTS